MSLFVAIIFLMTFTPIGFINLGFINATIVHVPVIIGSIMLGPKRGAALGALFGLASLIRNTMTPLALSFAFSPLVPSPITGSGSPWALVICFVPRVLVGVVPYYADRFLSGANGASPGRRFATLAAAGVAGSLTNTLLVMHLMYFVFREEFANARNAAADAVYWLILSIIATNGVPEAIVAGVITSAVCKTLMSYMRGRGEL
jgi:uncharacterized membrane protein